MKTLLCGVLALFVLAQSAPIGDIVGIQLLHRHGDRSPYSIAPAREAIWQDRAIPSGQLSAIGQAQHVSFGTYLKEKYVVQGNVLPPKYSVNHAKIRSTDVDRCLASAQSLLKGLWPTDAPPVHTVDLEYENLLRPTDQCASYVSTYTGIRAQLDELAVKTFPAELINRAYEFTGFPKTMGASNLIELTVDNIICERAHNVSTTDAVLVEQLEAMRDFVKDMYFEMHAPVADDARGPIAPLLMHQILGSLEARAKNPDSTRIIDFLSAHDTTVLALLTSLGLLPKGSEWYLPPYAASVTVQLRKMDTTYYVNGLLGEPEFLGGNTASPTDWKYNERPLHLCPEGKEQCTLAEFAAFVNKIAPAPTRETGCCLRGPSFAASGCDKYDTAYDKMPHACQVWRRTCPATSCGADQVLSEDLNCVAMTQADSDVSTWRGATIGLAIVCAITVVVAVVLARRAKQYPTPLDSNYSAV